MNFTRAITAILATTMGFGIVAPTANAETNECPIVGETVRDNVDNGHSPPATLTALPDTTTPPCGPSAAANTSGIDVSAQQHPADQPIDWAAVAGAGYRFAGVKATEGDYYENDWYATDRDGADAAGMYPFAYHFATRTTPPPPRRLTTSSTSPVTPRTGPRSTRPSRSNPTRIPAAPATASPQPR